MKYIFIDTNQYRHIFSKNEGFSDEIKKLLDKLINNEHVKLLLPQQVKEEVERNRFENWYSHEIKDNKKKIEKIENDIKEFEGKLSAFPKEMRKIRQKLEKDSNLLKKEEGNVKKRYRTLKSKANQKLKALFDEAEFIPETEEIVLKAKLRLAKNNPPTDNKLGDALIWESLLSFLGSSPKGSNLIFVARDGNAWGENGFNPWLARELKEKTGVSVSLTCTLSDINYLTKQEQESLRKKEGEERKENIVNDFVNSGSFEGAGRNARELLLIQEFLTNEDYKKIFNASLSNNQIYQSFFARPLLRQLFDKGDGYVKPIFENASKKGWESFCTRYNCELKRQIDQPIVAGNEIDSDF